MTGIIERNRPIVKADIMPLAEYAKVRDDRRKQIGNHKKLRRIAVGPDVTLYFEDFATMLHQIHEMLFVEKGGEEQLADELRAYNPLIPDGSNLVATLMIEIADGARRDRVLRQLTGIEHMISLSIDGDEISAVADDDLERTTSDGKTSSVHFLKFHLSVDQIRKFRTAGTRIDLAIHHPGYNQRAELTESARAALAVDFD